MKALAAALALASLVAATSAGDSDRPRTASQICSEAVPNWRTATPTTVEYIRHFETSGLQKVSPFATAFGSAPAHDLAAWCWVQRGTTTFRAYAATHDQKPLMIAEVTGGYQRAPKGPPTIV